MFKKILNVLAGTKGAEPFGKAASPKTAPAPPELITVYDAYGREVKITRDEWLEKVLKPNVQQAWGDADKLYNFIVSALKDDFAKEMIHPSARLLEIDTSIERSHVIRSIVLMKIDDLVGAERIIRKAISVAGETGTLLTNLAKVQAGKGLNKEADETLERAIQIDPNMENGLGWWLAIQKERNGSDGYLSALKQASQYRDSWLPQLWLARHHLQAGEVSRAISLYTSVLQAGNFSNDALMMISGDLGNHKQIQAIIDLIVPVFDPTRHDPRTGINLLQAYLELRMRSDGESLLGRMYALNLVPYKKHFDWYSAEFQKIAAEQTPNRSIDPSNLEIETIALDRPVWSYSLLNPSWLIAEKKAELPKVALVSFSKVVDPIEKAEEQREDDVGRMTRAIPLYLSESIHYWTDLHPSTLIPCVKNGGPIVAGARGDDRELCTQFSSNYMYLMSGEIDASAAAWRLTCRVWHCATQKQLIEASADAEFSNLGTAILKLEEQVLAAIGHTRHEPHDSFYSRPPVEAMGPYLSGLGQHFMLTLLANEMVPKAGMWGERAMLEWPLNMALHWKNIEAAKLMYFSGIAKAAAYGSDVLPEFKQRTIEFLRGLNRDGSLVTPIAPLLSGVFRENMEIGEQPQLPEYSQWLERVNSQWPASPSIH